MQWRTIEGYEGYYEVSNTGKVRSVDRSIPDKKLGTKYLRGVISHCVNGRIRMAGGFTWKKIGKCNDYPVYGSTAEDELLLEVQERI